MTALVEYTFGYFIPLDGDVVFNFEATDLLSIAAIGKYSKFHHVLCIS